MALGPDGYNYTRRSLRDRILLGMFAANIMFSLGNVIPVALVTTGDTPATCGKLVYSPSGVMVGIGLFLFFSFFTLFVFLTMLMAVIGDAYAQAKTEAAEAEEKVNKVVSPGMPSRKVLALKVEGYFDHFRNLEC